MTVIPFVVNPLQENCYLLCDGASRQAAVIDPGMFFDRERDALRQYIQREQLTVAHVILTHGHFDHAMSCQWMLDTFAVAPTLHAADVPLLHDCRLQVQQFLHRDMPVTQPAEVHTVTEGDTITFGDTQLTVMHTPGHTPGGICLYCEREHTLFSGDTLFQGGVGRTDLPGGDYLQLMDSVRRLLTLPPDTTVLPGHGPDTTIGLEKRYNQIV